MSGTGVVLGFYRERAAALEAIGELRRQRFGRSAAIHKSPEGRVTIDENDVMPAQGALLGAALGLALSLVALLDKYAQTQLLPSAAAGWTLLLPPLAGALAGWLAAQVLDFGVSQRLMARYGRWVVRGETLVVVQASAAGMERALAAMRAVGSEGPAAFVVRPGAAELQRRRRGGDAASIAAAGAASTAAPVRREPLTAERLKAQARRLAGTHRLVAKAPSGQPLLRRLRDSEAAIEAVRESLSAAARLEQSVSISGEWLLDNTYLVQGQIKDVRRNLPRRYYNQLPVLAGGAATNDASAASSNASGSRRDNASGYGANSSGTGGTPRVYALALDLIAHTDARLDRASITDFLNAYQEVAPLAMGEVWAAPLMLRLALIENLRNLATRIDERQRERERADFWANRLRHSARRDADHLLALLNDLTRERSRLTPHFADRLRSQLLDEEAALTTVQSWLERKLDAPLSDIIQSEARRQLADQLSISNIIGSLRTLLELDWREIFEETSVVHAVLRDDPAGVYAGMDFATRDHYRHIVEEIARHAAAEAPTTSPVAASPAAQNPASPAANAPVAEREVARLAVRLAVENRPSADEAALPQTDPRGHIGYFLIDAGRAQLESRTAYRPRIVERARRWAYAHPALVYIGGIALLTLLLTIYFVRETGERGVALGGLMALGALVLLPSSELAVQLVDYALTRLLPPRGLPKMSFENGLPADCKTLIVVPMMLLSPDAIREDVERLEVRYLANAQDGLQFALLSDFADADAQRAPEDDRLLQIAVDGIAALNARYGADKFFLFHRERQWSPGEGRWIGWERKRGKLEELNTFLCAVSGEETVCPEENRDGSAPRVGSDILRVGNAEALRGIRFVITLDADTQLPHDTARHMIETLAHPLNRPGSGVRGAGFREQNPQAAVRRPPTSGPWPLIGRGYGVIQPMVSTALPSAIATRFSRLMTDPRGTDPYTHLVSNVYQDLSGEGAYHGKGMYDLRAFHRTLSGRFPEATLLSHDLLEGAHVRVGLATDIELFDQFPANDLAYAKRQHRWIRGDWQISDWAFGSVPSVSGGREPNPLSALNRWKIFDNLRRSLVPVATVALLLGSWLLWPGAAKIAGALVAGLFLLPALTQLATWLTSSPLAQPFPGRALAGALGRAVFGLAALPHQAGLSVDAIARVLYRRKISRRNLLEWQTSQVAASRTRNQEQRFIWRLGVVSLLAVGIAVALFAGIGVRQPVVLQHESPPGIADAPQALIFAAPLLLLWLVSPLLVKWLSGGRRELPVTALPAEDKAMLRQVARETWRYFDDFIGPQTNWLPPDNYQEHLNVEVAPRTSPTNIGMWLLSALAARDFGYLTFDQVTERALATTETLEAMERHDGHLFNWYDIATTAPLNPRYVSTVDSGNLLVSLWTLAQGGREMLDKPVLDASALRGLHDTLAVLSEQMKAMPNPPAAAAGHLETLSRLFADYSEAANGASPSDGADAARLDVLIRRLRAAGEPAYALTRVLRETQGVGSSFDPPIYWADALERQVAAWNAIIDRYLLWAVMLAERSGEFANGASADGASADAGSRRASAVAPSLRELAEGRFRVTGSATGDDAGAPPAAPDAELAEAASKSRWLAGEMLAQTESLIERADQLANAMNLRPLYDARRKLFSIGLNVSESRLDASYYDLLASECRLASFAAIARGDVPVEHWLQLRRLYAARDGGGAALMSWSGTMFEYLMPLLLTRAYENSLLDYACRAAVLRQIEYGRRRGIPWGISEAAYSALDAAKTYQYQAFGVPGLGLKRGLEDDLVVAPYATALALLVEPVAAVENLKRLQSIGARGSHGFYESIDYTRARAPAGERGVLVRAFMVHHQGMSLLAFDNLLHEGIMQTRFHADPRVQATAPLLYESVPTAPPLLEGATGERAAPRLEPIAAGPAADEFQTPDTPTPRVNLLSNGAYALMVTNAGGGYSRWRDMDITRWRADTTRDHYGSFVYVRDLDEGFVWSNTFQPVARRERRYGVTFAVDRAEFRRRDAEIETRTEMVVSPEDDAEIRRVTLTNTSKRARRIELTSYCELALAPHATDRAHPAFAKLFVQTEAVQTPSLSPTSGSQGEVALLAWRRPRSPKDTPIWAGHVLASDERGTMNGGSPNRNSSLIPHPSSLSFETDRAKFIGRGRDAANPVALEGELSNTAGAVLDPVFSLRRRIVLQPGEQAQVSFVMAAGESRQRVLALLEKYADSRACERAFELAWINAQLEMYRLRLEPENGQVFQQLAGHMIYPHAQMRAPARRLRQNRLGQTGLWAHGISGDLPICVVNVQSTRDLRVVREALLAHAYWRARGLKTDLVILNEEAAGYEMPLRDQLAHLAHAHAQGSGLEQPGGIFVRQAGQLPGDDMTLLLGVARVVLVAARGNLAQQMSGAADDAPRAAPGRNAPRLVFNRRLGEEPSAPLPFMELPYFNGLGGFTHDGREYAIYLGPGDATPAPWINVMANEAFGALVSESGPGFCWSGNSQSNRLTPWSNDPVSDPTSEAIYIRDDDTGTFWTPTPLPVRELDAYRTRHGQGYTVFEHNSHAIEQELIVFVPVAAGDGGQEMGDGSAAADHLPSPISHPPIRIQRLRLRNRSSRTRRLSVMSYAEWTLGTTREETATHIITQWDTANGLLLARNAYHSDFAERVAFVAASPAPRSHSGDRAEFLGRNGHPSRPAAMARQTLSGRTGAGLDPCAALQVQVEIEPGQDAEIIFVTGQTGSVEAAADLAARYTDGETAERALHDTAAFWERVLSVVQARTPNLAVNFMVNRWLLYQDLSCRIWARSAFYQSGGAYGFRDQLQDVMALCYAAPSVAREQILRAAAHQFIEGDVLHWWHPFSGAGVRTRFSDDLLWLPFVVSHYVRVTGDDAVLDAVAPFIEGKLLDEGEHEIYMRPDVSSQSATILEHCRRSIEKGLTAGAHGLPLMGIGDWNDGMSRVGVEGRGESVWLAWFLVDVLHGFADLCALRGDNEQAALRRAQAAKLAATVEREAWDGAWYRRAYFDDGSPLGSHRSDEAKIDSLPQSWGILCGAANKERVEQGMRAVEEHLIRDQDQMILLFTPPFDKSSQDPGYIKGYVPGVRENGGQYTHAAIWVVQAFARQGDGDRAVQLMTMLNPVEHARTPAAVERYKTEPYVVAADVYALEDRVGQGGWTWYTGSASWMYRVWLEDILGFHRRGDTLFIQPSIPRDWTEYSLGYRCGASWYDITVENPDGANGGVSWIEVDGERLPSDAGIPLRDDGANHTARVRLGNPNTDAVNVETATTVEDRA